MPVDDFSGRSLRIDRMLFASNFYKTNRGEESEVSETSSTVSSRARFEPISMKRIGMTPFSLFSDKKDECASTHDACGQDTQLVHHISLSAPSTKFLNESVSEAASPASIVESRTSTERPSDHCGLVLELIVSDL